MLSQGENGTYHPSPVLPQLRRETHSVAFSVRSPRLKIRISSRLPGRFGGDLPAFVNSTYCNMVGDDKNRQVIVVSLERNPVSARLQRVLHGGHQGACFSASLPH